VLEVLVAVVEVPVVPPVVEGGVEEESIYI